jgi:hypothetical protein
VVSAARESDGVTQSQQLGECNRHSRGAVEAVNGLGAADADVHSCLCMCGAALQRSGVLFTRDVLGAAYKAV